MVFWRASPIFYKVPHPRATASRDLSRRRERLFQAAPHYSVASTTGSPTRITPGARVQAKTPT